MGVALLDRRRQRLLDGSLRRKEGRWEGETQGVADMERSTGPFERGEHPVRTLDKLITDTWDGLIARETVSCPACRGRMAFRSIAPGEVQGGDCSDCGARLS